MRWITAKVSGVTGLHRRRESQPRWKISKQGTGLASVDSGGRQGNLEDLQAALYPERVLLCDRGTVDGAVYWPGEPDGFFEELKTSLEAELERYDAVIFFESAAVGGMGIEGGNPIRSETMDEAVDLNSRLRAIWAQ
ncbi:MAG: AAA family ATPase, partial [Verrucomicrobia bacterium]|nr:AAA family ATPase [Verrucomicrobiota bacterium]